MKYIAILAALAAFNAGAITATKEYVDAKDSAISTNLTNLVATTAQGLRSEVSSTYATKSTTYTKSAVDSLLAGKQAALTAGNNVIITNGTISAVDTVYNDTAIRGRVSSLESGVAGWNAKVDASQLAPYATRDWVSSLGYLTILDLSPYALKEWVNSQSFLTASALTPYATTAWVNGLGYATRTWVNDKGYATTSWVNSQVYATESWVTGRCYVVRSDLNGYATTNALNGKADTAAVSQALALKADKTDVKAIAAGDNVTIITNGNSLVISASGGGSSGTIPTKVSQLTNDLGFVTAAFVPTRVKNDADTCRIDGEGNVYAVSKNTRGTPVATGYKAGTYTFASFNSGVSTKWICGSDANWLTYNLSTGYLYNGNVQVLLDKNIDLSVDGTKLTKDGVVVGTAENPIIIQGSSYTQSIIFYPQGEYAQETNTDRLARESDTVPSSWANESSIKWNKNGTAITVSVAANGTLSANLTGWTDGQSQTARITIASGASIATNVKFVGYGYWPTDEEFLAVCVRVGSSIFVNVITAIN